MGNLIYPTVPVAKPAATPWPEEDALSIRLDETLARRLDNDFSAGVRTLLHDPQTGLSSLKGEAALEAIAGALPALENLKQRTLAGASNARQQALLAPLMDTRLDGAAGTIGRLAERATVEVDEASVAGRLESLRQDAALEWRDPSTLRRLGRTAVEELRYQGERRGWDPAETEANIRGGLSDLYAGAVEAAIGQDIDGAARLYGHARDVIAPERQAAIDRRFTVAREDATVREVDHALTETTLDPAGPPDAETLTARAAELTPPDASEATRSRIAQVAEAAQRRLERQWNRQQAAAGVAAFEWLGANPEASPILLPWQIREWLAPDQVRALESMVIDGRLTTDSDLFEELDRQAIYDPAAFVTRDLDRHRLSLDDSDYARLSGFQKALSEGRLDADQVRYQRARYRLDDALDAKGIDGDSREGRITRANVRDAIDRFGMLEARAPNGRDVDVIVDAELAQAGRGIAPVVEPHPGSPEHEEAYRQLDLEGVFERPLVADSPRLKELIRNGAYSRLYPNYHEYELPPAVLCTLGQEGCSVERAYEALRIHAVPGGPGRTSPVTDGERSPAGFADIPGGHVLTYVEEGTHSIINVTEPDHVLRDGLVQRRIVVEGDQVVLRTFGIGNNASRLHARANEKGAGLAFVESTDRIRSAMNPESERRSREGWYMLTPNPAMGPSGLNP